MERRHSKKGLKDTAPRVHNIPTIMDAVQMPKIEFVDVTDIFNKDRFRLCGVLNVNMKVKQCLVV